MNGLQTISIRAAREQLSELVNQVAIARKQFVITKFGKPRAVLSPVIADEKAFAERKKAIMETSGAWKHRKDIKDSAKWVASLRHRMSSRYGYGKIFS